MERAEFIEKLLETLEGEIAAHPAARARDIVKFLFQGMLGVGHMLSSREKVTAYIESETAGIESDGELPLYEDVGPDWIRLNLARAKAEGIPAPVIAGMMFTGWEEKTVFSRRSVYDAVMACAKGKPCPEELHREAQRILDEDWLPSHSEEYRMAYRPAYRLIPSEWTALLPVICRAANCLASRDRVLITMDGPCASGKTSMAERLAGVLGAALVHTDDFVVPHAFKTKERLSIPGGNCDHERLVSEVIRPWKLDGACFVKRYACRLDEYLTPEEIKGTRGMLLEGSYCNMPAIREYADIRAYVDTPEEVRMERLRRRESPEWLQGFFDKWIPLENTYFSFYGIPDEECLRVPGCGRQGN